MAIFLTHYWASRWARSSTEWSREVIKSRKKAAAAGKGEDKKANVNDAVQMHSGGKVHDKVGSRASPVSSSPFWCRSCC